MPQCSSCKRDVDDPELIAGKYCKTCYQAAWSQSGEPWRLVFSEEALSTMAVGLPRMTAWCCWGAVQHEADAGPSSGSEMAGAVIGGLLGGGIGAAVGGAIGSAASGGREDGSASRAGCTASVGFVAITDSEVVVVDCGSRYLGRSPGISKSHVNDIGRQAADRKLVVRVVRSPLSKVRAYLRHSGATLELLGLDADTWLLSIGSLGNQPSAHDFVRAIEAIPELPGLDDFMDQMVAGATTVDGALLDATVADGVYIDKVLARMGRLKRDPLARFLENVARTSSRSFQVLIEAWLVERGGGEAGAKKTKSLVLLILGAPAALYALVATVSASGDEGPGPLAVLLGVCSLVLLPVSLGFWLSARRAEWYSRQTELLRAGMRG